jgi:multidrug efflux system membrane fusion protein
MAGETNINPQASIPSRGNPAGVPRDSPPPARRHLARIISMISWIAAVVVVVITLNVFSAYPRTSDAFVRANIIGIAPHVAGMIMELNVRDNQRVEAGELLFVVDPRPYEAMVDEILATVALTELEIEAFRQAVHAAKAELAKAEAVAVYAIDHLARLEPLLERRFVTPDEVQLAQSNAVAAENAARAAAAAVKRAERLVGDEGKLNVRLAQVQAKLANAELNLSYCQVTAPVAGYVTNLNIVRGEYANQGLQVFSIVDDSVWYVLANYRETLLDRIEPGMVADIWLLACPGKPLRGVVEGVSNAIHQSVGANVDGLADIAPALDWVRLAQRFAVRIILDDAPDCSMRSGSTATVRIRPDG